MMVAISRIVAATDLSPASQYAARRAAQLARSTGASLTLLHASGGSALDDMRRWLAGDASAEQTLLDKAKQGLHELAVELEQQQNIAVEERLCTSHPVEAIGAVAQELHADLVVTGTRGADLARWLVGSVAERAVRTSLRPVLLVRRPPRLPYRRVLVAVDFSIWSELAIHTALRVVPGAHLVLMHALDVPMAGRMRLDGVAERLIEQYLTAARAEAQEKLADLAGLAGLAAQDWTAALTVGVDPWTAIVEQEQAHDCDLIVIGKQGRSALGEFLLGSVTSMVIAQSEADVLVAARAERRPMHSPAVA